MVKHGLEDLMGNTVAYLRLPHEGEALSGGLTFKATSTETAGHLTLAEHRMELGQGARFVHLHRDCDEAWWVLEGEVAYWLGDHTVLAPAGSFVFVPSGVAHCYWNPHPAPARVMMEWMPGGFEGFFREIRQVIEAGITDPAILGGVWEKYHAELQRNPDGSLITIDQLPLP